MKFVPFDLFRKSYDVSFFQKNTLSPDVSKFKLVSTSTAKTSPSYFYSQPRTALPSPIDAHKTLATHIEDVIASRDPAQIYQAAQNVARFNAAHTSLHAAPKNPVKPLPHPAILRTQDGLVTVKQLAYELHETEALDRKNRDYHSDRVQDWKTFGAQIEVAPYVQRMKTVMLTDVSRLTNKYQHIGLVAEAALVTARSAQRVVTSRIGSQQGFAPDEVYALRVLHQELKRSLAAANSDLVAIEGMYARAQSAVMQFHRLKPGAAQDTLASPLRMDNVFGPGEVVADSMASAQSLKAVVRKFLEALSGLDSKSLRAHIGNLHAAQSLIGRVLRQVQSQSPLAATLKAP